MRGGNPSRRRLAGPWAKRLRALCVLLAAAALAPLPVAAQQAQGFSVVRTEIVDPMTVINDADMYFGRISPGTADGTVVMTPSGSSIVANCATNNGIVRTGDCRAARFQGTIPFIHTLQITKPAG